LVLFLAMCVIWGLPYLLIRVAVRDLSPATVVFARCLIGAGLLLPVAMWRRGLSQLRGVLGWVVLYTVVEVTVPWLLLTSAEQHLTSSMSGLLVAATPLIGVVCNRLAGGREVVGARRLTGLLVGLGGVAALVGLQVGNIDMVAVASIGAVAVGYACGPLILSRRLSEAPGIAVVAVSLAITAVVYAPWALTSHPHHVGGHVIAAMIALAVVCTAAAFLVFVALIAEVGPTRATVITYVNPAIALALGVTFLGEHVTRGMAVGFPLVIIGSVLATTAASSRRRSAPEPLDDLGAGELGQGMAWQDELGPTHA
jgi:drug/metabolite transporter (DMT)-like permease